MGAAGRAGGGKRRPANPEPRPGGDLFCSYTFLPFPGHPDCPVVGAEPFSHHLDLAKGADPFDDRSKSVGADQRIIAGRVKALQKSQKIKCGTDFDANGRIDAKARQ
jgi:hypothetical protein